MRKLLVASQKGGVGKTTTSMNLAAAAARAGARVLLLDADPLSNISVALNLAAHPRRQSLRQIGVDLPGALVCNVLPGLDVVSPYDEGRCSDAEFDQILDLLAASGIEANYGCFLLDAPPFLGGNPRQLLAACDEFLLVMRAEPLAARTLPAFLELIQRNRPADRAVPMRGILLTLNPGEAAGDRSERELRGRFGTRILPNVIPHDEAVPEALLYGRIPTHASPESAVAREYTAVAASLQLTEIVADDPTEPILVPLLRAVERRPATASSGVRRSVRGPAGQNGTALLDGGDDSSDNLETTLPETPPTERDERPQRRTPARRSAAVRAVPRPAVAAEAVEAIEEVETVEEAEVVVPSAIQRGNRANGRSERRPAERREEAEPEAEAAPEPAPAPEPVRSRPAWMIAVFLAAAVGFALGFVQRPGAMLPVLVGVIVAAGVILILHLALTSDPGRPGRKRHGSRATPAARLSKSVRRAAQSSRRR